MNPHNIKRPRAASCDRLFGSGLNALAISVALVLGLSVEAAHAQSPAPVQINIPVQPLNQALLKLGQQTDIQVYYLPETVADLQAPAVSGTLTAEQALAQLLRGTGIRMHWNGRAVSLSLPASGVAELAPVAVTGSYRGEQTEGSGSYRAANTSAATGLNLSLRDTPQSITVIAQQRMQDQALTSLSDVVNATTGVYNERMGTPIGGESFYYSRGYAIENLQIDGLPASPQSWSYYGAASLDTAIYDSVAIVRGASGLLTGAGDPSGSIHITRKRPTGEFQSSLEAGLGSWDRRRGVLDVSGPLNKEGTLRGRFITLYDRGDSWIDHYNGRKSLAYGVLEADLSDKTLLRLTLQHDQEKANNISYSSGLPVMFNDGLPTPDDRSMNTAPGWARKNERRTDITLALEHEFNPDWHGILSYSYGRRKYDDQWYKIYEVNHDLEITDLWVGNNDSIETKNSFNAHLNGSFELFNQKHDLIAGFNGSRVHRDMATQAGGYVPGVFYGDGRLQFPPFDWSGFSFQAPMISTTEQFGVYLATRLRPTDRFSLIGGARWSDWKFTRKVSFPTEQKEHGVITPYVGLLFDLNDNLTAYASYTKIFKPQNKKDLNGNTLNPEAGENYELGLKAELLDKRLNVSMAVFEVRKNNLAVMDGNSVTPEGTPAYRAEGHTKGRGWEIEAAGEITPGWNIQAGYSRSLTRSSSGERLNTQIPVHLFKLYTTYAVRSLPGLRVGGGVQWQSKIYNSDIPASHRDIYTQKFYATVNLMGSYQFNKNLSLAVNVDNLFDKTYRKQINYRDYGAPRSVMATLRHQF